MRYLQRARRTNQRFMVMSVIMGLLLIAIVYGFLWWASGSASVGDEENVEKADTVTSFFTKSACYEAKNA